MNEKIKQLDARAVSVATQYNNCEAQLISILQDIGKLRGYLQYGFSSLHDYCVRRLKLSDATTSNLIAVARKSIEVPELRAAIEAGALSVSKARKITPVLTKQNKTEWIELAQTKSSREIEKAVAAEKPELLIIETTKYKAADRIEFKVGVSEELLKKLEKIKDLESQRTSKAVSFEDTLIVMAELYLEKNDPVRKAERAHRKIQPSLINPAILNKPALMTSALINSEKISTQGDSKSVPGQRKNEQFSLRAETNLAAESKNSFAKSKFRRAALNSAVKHAVTLRDLRQCAHVSLEGKRCAQTRWLDVHHVIPVSRGGTNELANLTTLCSAHHKLLHERH